MHITLETDYAIRIIDLLAKNAGGSCSHAAAKTISERTGVPHRYALKILRKLVTGEVVRSYKGSRGGYELLRAPSEISLCDVVEIMEGEYVFSRCLENDYNCTSGCECGYQKVFGDISKLVRDKLKEHKFG
jgi:Rrf2 family protein